MNRINETFDKRNRALAAYEAAKRKGSLLTGHNQRSSRGEYAVMQGQLLDGRKKMRALEAAMGWGRYWKTF